MKVEINLGWGSERDIVVKSLDEVVSHLSNCNDEWKRFEPDWERTLNAAKCIIDYYSAPSK